MKQILSLILIAFLFPISVNAAISFDTGSTLRDSSTGDNTLTQSVTFAASNEILVGCARTASPETISSMTYNGVSMTQFSFSPITMANGEAVAEYYLTNPASGSAHNLVVTFSGTNSQFIHYLGWSAYAGASLTGIPDNHTVINNSNSSPLTTSVTVNTANSWTVLCIDTDNGGLAASTGSTLRGSISGSQFGVFDSNGPLSAGSQSMTVTFGAGSANGGYLISLAPPVAASVPIFQTIYGWW